MCYGLALRLKQYDVAISWIRVCLELNPFDFDVYNFLGTVYLQRKDFLHARECYE